MFLEQFTSLDRYEIIHRYDNFMKAYDHELKEEVMLQVFALSSLDHRQLLQRLYKYKLYLKPHPNVIGVSHIGLDTKREEVFIASPWVEGVSLEKWQQGHALEDWDDLLNLAHALTSGLEAIHEFTWHGSIQLNQVLVASESNAYKIYWQVPGLLERSSTFVAPEKRNGQTSPVDEYKADIYGFGALLYFLFTSHFHTEVMGEGSILRLPSLRYALYTSLPEMDELIKQMLQPSPDERHLTASDIRGYFARIIESQQRAPDHNRGKEFIQQLSPLKVKVPDIETKLQVGKAVMRSLFQKFYPHLEITGRFAHIEPGNDDLFLQELFGGERPLCCILENAQRGQVDAYQLSFLIPLANNYLNDTQIRNLGRYFKENTLRFTARYMPASKTLQIQSVEFVYVVSVIDASSLLEVKARFRLDDPNINGIVGIPTNLLNTIQTLRVRKEYKADDNGLRHIQLWERYLEAWRAHANTLDYEFDRAQVDIQRDPEKPDILEFRFKLKPKQLFDLWKKINKSIDGILHIGRRLNNRQSISNPDELTLEERFGVIHTIDEARWVLRVRVFPQNSYSEILDTQAGRNAIYFRYYAGGDLSQINYQLRSMKDLMYGQTGNRSLNHFLFDPSQVIYPGEKNLWIDINTNDLFHKDLNPEQLEAVQAAINSPDLFLLQGPPGTGKTTVIAELCYQFTRMGKRVLLSSQSNLAVDNTLRRLPNSSHMMPIRIGRVERVEPEGRRYLVDTIAQDWFADVLQQSSEQFDHLVRRRQEFATISDRGVEFRQWIEESEECHRTLDALTTQARALQEQLNRVQTQQTRQAYLLKNAEATLSGLHELKERLLEAREFDWEHAWLWNQPPHPIIQSPVYRIFVNYLSIAEELARLTQPETLRQSKQALDFDIEEEAALSESGIDGTPMRNHRLSVIFRFALSMDAILLEIVGQIAKLVQRLEVVLNQIQSDMKPTRQVSAQQQQQSISRELLGIAQSPIVSQLCRTLLPIQNFAENNNHIQIRWVIGELNHATGLADDLRQRLNLTAIDSCLECLEGELTSQVSDLKQSTGAAEGEVGLLSLEYAAVLTQQERWKAEYLRQEKRWTEFHDLIPDHALHLAGDEPYSFSPAYMEHIYTAFSNGIYEEELERQSVLLPQMQTFVAAWRERLAAFSEQDSQDAKLIYRQNANIVGVTCGQIPLLRRESYYGDEVFDVVIIEEASRATAPELLLPILRAKQIILVGDHRQLPAQLLDDSIEQVRDEFTPLEFETLSEPLFGRLYIVAPTAVKKMLKRQYRMTQSIMRVINQFYGDKLEGGHNEWHIMPLGDLFDHPKSSLIWYKTPISWENEEERAGSSRYNVLEVDLIVEILTHLDNAWRLTRLRTPELEPKQVSIITFYRAQRDLIRAWVPESKFEQLNLRIGTVDHFQGMESDVVIVSMVRNNQTGHIGFAQSTERINVAFSRARQLLIIIGCQELFTGQFMDVENRAREIYTKIARTVKEEGCEFDVFGQ